MIERLKENFFIRAILSSIGGTLILKIFSTFAVFVTSSFLAKVLGAKGYGVYAFIIALAISLSVLAKMGIDILLVREVSIRKENGNPASIVELMRWSRTVVLYASVLAVVVGVIYIVLFSRIDRQSALWVLVFLVPVLAIVNLQQGALQGFGEIIPSRMPTMFITPVFTLVGVVVWYKIRNSLAPGWALSIYVTGSVLALVYGYYKLSKLLSTKSLDINERNTAKIRVRNLLPFLVVSISGLLTQQLSVIIVGGFLTSQDAGIFDVVTRLANFITFVTISINVSFSPIISRFHARGDYVGLQMIAKKFARLGFAASLLIGAVILSCQKWIFLFFGKDFSGGSAPLIILCAGFVVSSSLGSVEQILNMTSYEKDVARGVIVAVGTFSLFNSVLIPLFGLVGAALANALSFVIWRGYLVFFVYKRTGINPSIFKRSRSVPRERVS